MLLCVTASVCFIDCVIAGGGQTVDRPLGLMFEMQQTSVLASTAMDTAGRHKHLQLQRAGTQLLATGSALTADTYARVPTTKLFMLHSTSHEMMA
jgi:hypothetical protein